MEGMSGGEPRGPGSRELELMRLALLAAVLMAIAAVLDFFKEPWHHRDTFLEGPGKTVYCADTTCGEDVAP